MWQVGHIANAYKTMQDHCHDANVVVREEDSESETNDDTGLFNIDMVASNPAPIMVSVSIN